MKYTVLTYIFGGYEQVHEIGVKDPDAEYLLITDDPTLKSDTWQVVVDTTMEGWPVMEKCYYTRFHLFQWAHTDVVVRIDGSIGMHQPLTDLMQAFEDGQYDRCLMIHPARNQFDKELTEWVRIRNYSREVADRCLKMMQGFGYDLSTQGMFQGCFEIVRKTAVNLDANRLTYCLMKYTGGEEIDRLDQHILSFVIATQFKDAMKILPVSQDIITNSDLMTWYLHNSHRKNLERPSIAPVMFGKPVETWK